MPCQWFSFRCPVAVSSVPNTMSGDLSPYGGMEYVLRLRATPRQSLYLFYKGRQYRAVVVRAGRGLVV